MGTGARKTDDSDRDQRERAERKRTGVQQAGGAAGRGETRAGQMQRAIPAGSGETPRLNACCREGERKAGTDAEEA